MHKLLVLYPEPTDPDHFRDYYVSKHLPLVARMPGLLAFRYSFEVTATQGQTPYFAVFEAEWWHYDYRDWEQYPILNVPFEELE